MLSPSPLVASVPPCSVSPWAQNQEDLALPSAPQLPLLTLPHLPPAGWIFFSTLQPSLLQQTDSAQPLPNFLNSFSDRSPIRPSQQEGGFSALLPARSVVAAPLPSRVCGLYDHRAGTFWEQRLLLLHQASSICADGSGM